MGSTSRVPPGFRFHPTDEELVNYYLRKKVNFEKFDLDVIRDVDLNKLEPWDLHERCRIDTAQQTEWYFFSHKDKKYPTGTRTNRATAAGFWKATGRDKAVHTTCTLTSCPLRIGMRKTLVFYRGRAPHGQKTDWIMHEYRLEDGPCGSASAADIPPANEDGWVVCRVFKKRIHHQKPSQATSQAPLQASEEEQSSQDVVETANYNHDNYNSFQPNNAPLSASNCLKFSCKKEDDYAENTLLQVPFLHMPHLESPKEYASAENAGLFHDLVDYPGKRSLIMGEPLCYKRPIEALTSSFMPLGEMQTLDTESYTKSLIFGCENDSLVTNDIHWENDQWPGVLESLPKDMRYHHISGDTLSKTLLSANGDMDIWKPLL